VSLAAVTVLTGASAPAQPSLLVRFVVESGEHERVDTPVAASLEGLALGAGDLALYELVGAERRRTPSQLEPGFEARLWWILDGATAPGQARRYELVSGDPGVLEGRGRTSAVDDGETLTLGVGGHSVLRYQHRAIAPPPGTTPLYARSGFIHPLWSPSGEVLTRIQPPDHYHHVGIWNPWTHTEFQGREVDFWNLHSATGTVRFAGFLSRVAGSVYAGFEAHHEHVDLTAPDPSGARVALDEAWDVRSWAVDPENGAWIVDLVSTLSCATDSPLRIEEYRYQGFGFRGPATWDDATAVLLTSEGKSKADGNATRARWIDVRGPVPGGTAGVLFLSHPANFNHPEPLRIWPIGANGGKENVFVNFNPAQDRDWVLEPGRTYALRYRMVVYDGELDPADAERYWHDLARPPKVRRE